MGVVMSTPMSHHRHLRRSAAIATVVFSLSGARALQAQPDRAVLVAEPDGTYSSEHVGFTGYIHPDGSVSMVDRPIFQLQGLGASFDITEIAMRARGMDPYASEKLAYLDRTRDMRAEMGAAYREQQLALSPRLMRNNIETVLATLPDPRARKQALFELWDECAETGEPAIVAAGAAARAYLQQFIRREMTGPNAFTTAELASFNARRTSAIAFAPYDTTADETRYAMSDARR
jgi:hypothetical protein